MNTNGNPVKLAKGTVMRGMFINHDEPSTEIKAAKNLESMGSRLGTEVGMKLGPIAGTNNVSAKKRADTTQTQNENEMNTKTTEIGSELYTIANSFTRLCIASFELKESLRILVLILMALAVMLV